MGSESQSPCTVWEMLSDNSLHDTGVVKEMRGPLHRYHPPSDNSLHDTGVVKSDDYLRNLGVVK